MNGLTQPLFYSFDTKSKPGKIICYGVRFQVQEISATDDVAQIPLLCKPNLSPGTIDINALKHAIESNL